MRVERVSLEVAMDTYILYICYYYYYCETRKHYPTTHHVNQFVKIKVQFLNCDSLLQKRAITLAVGMFEKSKHKCHTRCWNV